MRRGIPSARSRGTAVPAGPMAQYLRRKAHPSSPGLLQQAFIKTGIRFGSAFSLPDTGETVYCYEAGEDVSRNSAAYRIG
jgi:hypothetical protein